MVSAIKQFLLQFLGEERWLIEINGSASSFHQRLRAASQRMARYRHILPYAGSLSRGFRSHLSGDIVILMKNPDTISLRSLFSTSGLYYFLGNIRENDGKLVLDGKYALTPLVSLLFLCFGFLSTAFVFASGIGIAYVVLLLTNTELAIVDWLKVFLVAVAACLVSILFCALIYLLSRINNNVIRPYRAEMRQFLIALGSQPEIGT